MKRVCGVLLILILAVMVPAAAHAEWFLEPYLGAAFTMNEDVDFSGSAPGVAVSGTFSDVDFEDSLLLGIRAGYWFPSAPNFGIGFDVFHFSPDIKTQTTTVTAAGAVVVGDTLVIASGTGPATLGKTDVDVFGFSADFMTRLTLMQSQAFPNGQLQPYAYIGPTIFVVEIENEDDSNIGLKLGAGVQWLLAPNIALFVEYRYTMVDAEVDDTSGSATATIKTDLRTHNVLAGISFRF